MIDYRVENKYLVTDADLMLLSGRLKNVMSQDIHQEGDCYEIRSLYFDDLWDRCLAENEAGVDKREKYRIRIYDPKSDVIHLEIKEKNRGSHPHAQMMTLLPIVLRKLTIPLRK